MPKKIIKFLILIIILGGAFFPSVSNVVYGQGTPPNCAPGYAVTADPNGISNDYCSPVGATGQNPVTSNRSGGIGIIVAPIMKLVLSGLSEILLMIGGLILALCGNIFNLVLSFTIVNFASQINDARGLGGSIDTAWSTLRDVGNMVFIFILLWAAIRLILGLGDGVMKTIRNIIIVGLLVNFSLFFTKVVIDASNIAAVGFYNSIMAGVGSNSQPIKIAGIPFDTNDFAGIFLQFTGVQTFYDASILTGSGNDIWGAKPLITGVMGLVTMLVLAIVLLVAAVMFIARFIILVFLMILSPLALIAFILPALRSKFDEWWDVLISQAFFAPFFMLLIWVAFRLMAGISGGTSGSIQIQGQKFAGTANSPFSALALIFNFILVIGFTIMALVLSKQMATKFRGFSAVAGGVAKVGFGTVAFAGRRTVGAVASRTTKSQRFQRLAARNPKTFGALYTGTQKAAKGSFDVRGIADTKVGKATGLGTLTSGIGSANEKTKGGFDKYKEEKTKQVIDKGKQFTDRQARADYARRTASGALTHRGSTPNNVNSMFGIMGSSNRIAAATLLDERIKELQTEMNQARSELNTLNNNMGFTPNAAAGVITPTPGQLALLSPSEGIRYATLNAAAGTTGSIAAMGAEQTMLRGDRTALGLDNTLRQQY